VERVGPAVVNIRTTERGNPTGHACHFAAMPGIAQSDEVPRGEGLGISS